MEGKMRICPSCGAGQPDGRAVICPYCGRELIDLSRENTDKKIREVKRAQAKTVFVPKRLGAVVAVTLLALFLLFALFVFLDIPDKVRAVRLAEEMNRLSDDMKSAYEKGDWDQLEEYLIDECEIYLDSPDYFCYRTAWFLHTYPPLFDEAYLAQDVEEMLYIYDIIAEDYDMRSDDMFFSVYGTNEEIEAALTQEVERETKILKEEGLEDEMYKLRR